MLYTIIQLDEEDVQKSGCKDQTDVLFTFCGLGGNFQIVTVPKTRTCTAIEAETDVQKK